MTRKASLAFLLLPLLVQPALARDHRDHGIHRPLFVAPNGKPYRAQPGDPYPVATWFAEADADHDGQMTRAEFRANFLAYFDTLDTDHDGEIAPDEIEKYETVILPEVHMNPIDLGYSQSDSSSESESGDAPRQPPERPGGAAFFGFSGAPEPLTAMDSNFNRGISRAEYSAAADRAFRKLDPQSHGYLTLDTLPKTAAQR